jgi:hypothetical protein
MLELRKNRRVSLVQQQKSWELNSMSLTRLILISLSASLSHLVAKGFYNTKQRKVQSYAQATLNVQHQAIQTPHFVEDIAPCKTQKQTEVGRNVLVSSSIVLSDCLRFIAAPCHISIAVQPNTFLQCFQASNPSLHLQCLFLF